MNQVKIASLYQNTVALAPMAGAADSAFRQLAVSYGAGFSVSEMVSAKALVLGDGHSAKLMFFTDAERPFGIQLFGHDPKDFARAAKIAERDFRPDFLDLNMGCPAPKIVASGAGAAVMKQPSLAADIAKAVKDAVALPVTAKIRSGFDDRHKNAAEVAGRLQEAGIDGMVVHGKSREQMYRPPADLGVIREVAAAVSVPVLGNGEVACYEDAKAMLTQSGCAGVMVGRAALGNPFVFGELRAAFSGEPVPSFSRSERLAVFRRQVMEMIRIKGEWIAIREARKHAAWYLKGFRGAAELRKKAVSLRSLADIDVFIRLASSAGE